TCQGVGKITLPLLTTTVHHTAISTDISTSGGTIFFSFITAFTFFISDFLTQLIIVIASFAAIFSLARASAANRAKAQGRQSLSFARWRGRYRQSHIQKQFQKAAKKFAPA